MTLNVFTQELFRRLDVDDSGKISFDNLNSILGMAYSQEEIRNPPRKPSIGPTHRHYQWKAEEQTPYKKP